MDVVDVLKAVVWVIYVIVYGYISALISMIVPPKRKSILGENVIITGAGHGIGREFALEIAKLGAFVVLLDVNQVNNEQALKDVQKAGGKGAAFTCNLASLANIKEVAAKIRSDVGEVSIVVNNAGVCNAGPFLELSEEDIRRTFDVNTLAHIWMIQEFLPSMIKRGRGHFLNVISMAGFSGFNMLTDYCGSKFGARGFYEALIEELSEAGHTEIKLTALCPMIVDTGLLKKYKVGHGDRVLLPNEVALAGIDGMLRNYEIVTVPSRMNLIIRITQLFPRWTVQQLSRNSGIQIRSQYKKSD